MPQLLFASNNKNKLIEIESVAQGFYSKILTPAHFDGFEPDEDSGTFVGNALIKARYWHQKTGLPALADDSGFCLNALSGWPGVETAPFSKQFPSYFEAQEHLWEKLTPYDDKSGQFVSFLAFIDASGEHIFEGTMSGNMVFPPRGGDGYAFDYVFVPHGENQTVAEKGRVWKGQHSHRAKALAKFSKFLESIRRNAP